MDTSKRELQFSEKKSLTLLFEDEDIAILSIYLLHQDDTLEDHNLNYCNISHECIEKSIDSMRGKPIVYRLSTGGSGVEEHARNDKERNEMRVAGIIPVDSDFTFVKDDDNGKTYLVCDAILYKKYCPQLMNILVAHNGELEVSTEMKAVGYQNEDNGIFYMESFSLDGTCILGENYDAGISGSHLKVMKFSKTEAKDANKRYVQFSSSKQSQDIITQIKNMNNQKENTILNSMTVEVLKRKIWSKLRTYKYSDGSWEGERYWYEDIDIDKHLVIVHDNQTDELYAIPYEVSEDEDVELDEEKREKVVKDESYRAVDNSCDFLFAKEDFGTGEELKVDKSKDALSDDEWGKVNKTTLRKDVLDAKNYESIVKDVYLKVEEGWEDAPSEKLKYPVMEIKGDTLVYNRYALASALAYAKTNEEEDVIGKVMELYDELDIDDEEKVDNKLDEDNPEVKKIKDDADAEEDDKKEDLKEEDNSIVDKPAEDALADDVDSDKDYWKKKYEEKDNECKGYIEKLAAYKLAEDKVEMNAYMDKYSQAFSDEELKVMASKIENMGNEPYMECEDFKKMIDEKFVVFLKEKYDREEAEKAEKKKEESNFSIIADFTARVEKEVKPKSAILSTDEILSKLHIK